MPDRFHFSQIVLESVAGGKSVIDLPRLACRSEADASQFLLAYGYDLENLDQAEKLWHIHRRALVLLTEKMGFMEDQIPSQLRDRRKLGDLRRLLIFASMKPVDEAEKTLQRWSCSLLRVMHAFVHSETDLFSQFTQEIQNQVLSPVQSCIVHDGLSGKIFLQKNEKSKSDLESIPLVSFQVKPFKTSSSSVIKLLAKPDALAMNIYDRLGFRLVTENLFDCFRVLRFLVESSVVSYPHVLPHQSTNTLYPVDLFLDITRQLEKMKQRLRGAQLEEYLMEQLENRKDEINFVRKDNQFSSVDYRFIKFIARKLIVVPAPSSGEAFLRFFFPYEVQIMDQKSFERMQAGPSHHDAYKDRQVQAARLRVFPDT